jgi:hypothetical protein
VLAFLTLLLGIITGPRQVALTAPENTRSIEIFVDDQRVGIRRSPPWEFKVDFGTLPAPHHLDAVARDGREAEIGRVRQLVNFPRPENVASLALLPGTGGRGRTARLDLESLVGSKTSLVAVSFDGVPLAAPNPLRIELPSYAPGRLHFLRAVIDLSRGGRLETEITIGGKTHDETSRELTAVILRVPGGKAPPPEEMTGWLVADGTTPRVVAVEGGAASIVFVLDADGPAAFQRLLSSAFLRLALGKLHGDPEVRTMTAYPEFVGGSQTTYEVFPRSLPQDLGNGLLEALGSVSAAWYSTSTCPRFADAVTAAGLVAAEWSHPRAVVLVLTGNPDLSVRPVQHARAFLADLGVPLVVWTVGAAAPEAASAWGGGRSVKTLREFRAAIRALDAVVAGQRVVWIEGIYLPQSVSLGPSAPAGVEIAR